MCKKLKKKCEKCVKKKPQFFFHHESLYLLDGNDPFQQVLMCLTTNRISLLHCGDFEAIFFDDVLLQFH